MFSTPLIARRVGRDIPIWDVLAHGAVIGSLTNLPLERAWCLTARYLGSRVNFRASTREAILLALRCAVDAIDHDVAQADLDDGPEDEDGEIARMRWEENRAEEAFHRFHGYDPEPSF
jgi:hypothetical protein